MRKQINLIKNTAQLFYVSVCENTSFPVVMSPPATAVTRGIMFFICSVLQNTRSQECLGETASNVAQMSTWSQRRTDSILEITGQGHGDLKYVNFFEHYVTQPCLLKLYVPMQLNCNRDYIFVANVII